MADENKHGTKSVGYLPPTEGPFYCGHCEHYEVKANGSGCNQEQVRAELGEGKNGLAPVDDGGCCNLYEKKSDDSEPATMPSGKVTQKAKKGGIGLQIIHIGRKAS